MSRKWERMVEKNRKVTNKQRLKQGKLLITDVNKEAMQHFLGRSWFLALICIGLSLFFTAAYGSFFKQDAMTKFVTVAYFALGLFIYFVRRPRLSIGKTTLSSRRFSRDVSLSPSQIEDITLQQGNVIIQLKHKKSRWIFSRIMHRFDIKSMSDKIKEYAAVHGITLIDHTKGE
jgi:uncharacterized membrane protein YobD (UPF0266 family)